MYLGLIALILWGYPRLELWWGSTPHLSCAYFVALFCVFCFLTVQRVLDYLVKSYESSLKIEKESAERWGNLYTRARDRETENLRMAERMSGRIIRPGAMDAEHTWVLVKKREYMGRPICLLKSGDKCPFFDSLFERCVALDGADCDGTVLPDCPVHNNNKQTQIGI